VTRPSYSSESTQSIRATESFVSPLGWDRAQIRQYLLEERDVGLAAFE